MGMVEKRIGAGHFELRCLYADILYISGYLPTCQVSLLMPPKTAVDLTGIKEKDRKVTKSS
jgi:hypothetical protein